MRARARSGVRHLVFGKLGDLDGARVCVRSNYGLFHKKITRDYERALFYLVRRRHPTPAKRARARAHPSELQCSLCSLIAFL